jgi:hypothetical protein
MPQEDTTVLLPDGPDPEALRAIRAVFVRDVTVRPVGSPPPPVVGALHTVAIDLSAVTKVRPEVWAVGVEDVECSTFVAVRDELFPEITEWPYLTLGELD